MKPPDKVLRGNILFIFGIPYITFAYEKKNNPKFAYFAQAKLISRSDNDHGGAK
jgi:hypothetical protein